jgi:hypothetical protein
MSIKQNGGVFGRNPTFNDVTIEGQLTFDGDIDINSDLKIDGELEVTGEILANGGIALGDSDKATFGTGDDLQIYHDGANSFIAGVGTGNLYIRNSFDDKDVILQSDDGLGGVVNYVHADGSNGEVRLFHYGSEKFNTASSGVSVNGNVIMQTSGSGIDFSATAGTGTSELLDDYEEGTFTPTFSATGLTVTYDSQFGGYTKIGNVVYFRIQIGTDAVSGGSGSEALKISGLPFSAGSVSASSGFGLVYGAATSFADAKWLINSGTSLLLYAGDGTSASVFSDRLGTGVNSNRTYLTGHYYV